MVRVLLESKVPRRPQFHIKVHFFNGIFLPRQEIPASAGNYLPDGQEMVPAEGSVLSLFYPYHKLRIVVSRTILAGPGHAGNPGHAILVQLVKVLVPSTFFV